VGSSKGKRGSGKVREGFADARETGGGEEDVKTTIVVGGGGRDKNLGLGGKVVGGTMETMVGGERGVEGPGSEVVKGELGMWEQVVPAVRREGDVGGREDGNKMVLAVRIARSAGLERWLKGGTYWKVTETERKKEVRSDEVSLSRRRWLGQRVRKRSK
jgi:hypothetical protein